MRVAKTGAIPLRADGPKPPDIDPELSRILTRAKGSPGALPGVDLAYEPPACADLLAGGGRDAQAVERVLTLLGEGS